MRQLNNKERKMLIQWCMDENMTLEYGKLTLCDLRNFRYSQLYMDRRWQVHCEDSRCPWSMIYDELEPAIEKFLELKNQVRRIK